MTQVIIIMTLLNKAIIHKQPVHLIYPLLPAVLNQMMIIDMNMVLLISLKVMIPVTKILGMQITLLLIKVIRVTHIRSIHDGNYKYGVVNQPKSDDPNFFKSTI